MLLGLFLLADVAAVMVAERFSRGRGGWRWAAAAAVFLIGSASLATVLADLPLDSLVYHALVYG